MISPTKGRITPSLLLHYTAKKVTQIEISLLKLIDLFYRKDIKKNVGMPKTRLLMVLVKIWDHSITDIFVI